MSFTMKPSTNEVLDAHNIAKLAKDIFEASDMIEIIEAPRMALYEYSVKYGVDLADPYAEEDLFLKIAVDNDCIMSLKCFVYLFIQPDGSVEAKAFIHPKSEGSSSYWLDSLSGNANAMTNAMIEKSISMPKDALGKNYREEITTAVLNVAADELFGRLGGKRAGVASIAGNTIKLDRGRDFGIKKGDYYRVFAESELRTDMFSGERYQTSADLAIIRITDAGDNTSTGTVIANGGYADTIQVGDRFARIDEDDVKKLTRDISMGLRDDFPSERTVALLANSASDEHIGIQLSDANDGSIKNQAISAPIDNIVPSIPDGLIRLGVMKFDSTTPDVSGKEAEAITDTLSRMVGNSRSIALLERDRLEAIAQEHKLNVTGVLDPQSAVQLGKLAGCRYMLLGSVTNIEGVSSSVGDVVFHQTVDSNTAIGAMRTGGSAGKIAAGLILLDAIVAAVDNSQEKEQIETQSASVTIDARIVDVETGNIFAAMSGIGRASQSTVLQYGTSTEISVAEFGGLRSQAITAASSRVSLAVREKLCGELMKAVLVEGNEIILNRGRMAGIQRGDLCAVYPAEDTLRGKNISAVLIVNNIEDDFSVASIYGTNGQISSIKQGDVLILVTQEDLDDGKYSISDTRVR